MNSSQLYVLWNLMRYLVQPHPYHCERDPINFFVCLFEINNLKKEDSSIYQDERLTLPVLYI